MKISNKNEFENSNQDDEMKFQFSCRIQIPNDFEIKFRIRIKLLNKIKLASEVRWDVNGNITPDPGNITQK